MTVTARTSLIEASPGDQSPRDPRFVDGAPLASRQPEPPHTSRQVTAVVAVLSLAVFMASLDVFIVNLAFPYIARAYRGTSLSSLSWVLNGYSIVFAAVLVPAGRWADRLGRRRLFVAGLITFSVGSLLCGLASGVATLITARFVQALGAGMMVPASLSLLLAEVPVTGRAQAIGTWSALAALGAALGPVIGGSLVQISWRLVFWINLPVRLVALALVEAPDWGWRSADFLGLLAAAAACGAAVVVRSRRHPSPVIELSLLRSRTFSAAFAVSILYYAGFGAFVLNSVEFLTGEWGYSAVRAGLAIAPGPLMVLPFARLVAPRLAARLGGVRLRIASADNPCAGCDASEALGDRLLTRAHSRTARSMPADRALRRRARRGAAVSPWRPRPPLDALGQLIDARALPRVEHFVEQSPAVVEVLVEAALG